MVDFSNIFSGEFVRSDYSEPNSGSSLTLAQGMNTIRILCPAPVEAWRYFTEEIGQDGNAKKKVHYFPRDEKPVIPENISIDVSGKPMQPQLCWVVIVYDYKDNTLKSWTITQKQIRQDLNTIQLTTKDRRTDKPYHISKYDITIKKEGEKLATAYTVIPGQIEAFMLYKDGAPDEKKTEEVINQAIELSKKMTNIFHGKSIFDDEVLPPDELDIPQPIEDVKNKGYYDPSKPAKDQRPAKEEISIEEIPFR